MRIEVQSGVLHTTGLIAAAVALLSPCAALQESFRVASPRVIGPIATSSRPGDSARDYPFFASTLDLKEAGYIEEEFFLDGRARRFSVDAFETATVLDGDYPYKTRIVVRRPIDVERFNGTAVLEWLNVSVGLDLDVDWLQAHEHFVRAGYAWVGVSAQRLGIHGRDGLKAWSPTRYGSLDVTAIGTIVDDALAYDIFSQAGRVVRSPTTVRVLGALQPRVLIATGHSQSAERLATYYNSIQPLTGAFDGFLVHGGGSRLRTDLAAKAMKLVSEADLRQMRQAANRQLDTNAIRTWEVAGTSHADSYFAARFEELELRDFGSASRSRIECDRTLGSRIPFRYVMHSAYDRMVTWIRGERPPPLAPRITLSSERPTVAIARDTFGNALGGIRLSEHAVPTATNTGDNSGAQGCVAYGSYQPFESGRLRALYPTHAAYVTAVKVATDASVSAGYVLFHDAERTVREAQESQVGSR